MNKTSNNDLINEKEAAEILTVAVKTVRSWRLKKIGPSYIKIGRSVRYSRYALEKFKAANVVTCGPNVKGFPKYFDVVCEKLKTFSMTGMEGEQDVEGSSEEYNDFGAEIESLERKLGEVYVVVERLLSYTKWQRKTWERNKNKKGNGMYIGLTRDK